MYFNEIEIENYKCFRRPTRLKLEKGINIIVGQNNVGKTSILEILGLNFKGNPHISVETYSKHGQPPTKVTGTFTVTKSELIDLLLLTRSDSAFQFPLNFIPDKEKKDNLNRARELFFDFFSNENFTFCLYWRASRGQKCLPQVPDNSYIEPTIVRAMENNGETEFYAEFRLDSPENPHFYEIRSSGIGADGEYRRDFILYLGQPLCQHIYRFHADRVPYESCQLNKSRILLPNASNLAEVLDALSTVNRNKFNDLVRKVLPNIYQVDVNKNKEKTEDGKNYGQIIIWNDENSIDDFELGFTLDKCGSGVGQVLAILYVVLSKEPQVILIDEPQSFLHPNAARKLIEIIRLHGKQHQIIISTHSPAIITAAEPSTVTLIKQKRAESDLLSINIQNFSDLQVILSELGGRFSDVFGYDQVIWVEGPTEEKCFSQIVSKFQPLLGTAILRVQNTGDIDGKKKDLVDRIISIYERLSFANNGLVPTKIDFIFDKEARPPEKLRELEKLGFNIQNRQCVYFTSKRMYENYLLNPKALVAIINEIDGKGCVTLKEVNQWIKENKDETKYYENNRLPQNPKLWKDEIDAAKFLADLFSAKIQTKGIDYVKTIHSVRLTEWILENSPNDLKDITELLERLLNTNNKQALST